MAMRTLQSSLYLSSSSSSSPKPSSSSPTSSSTSSSSSSSPSSSFSLPNIPLIPPKPNKSVLHKHPLYAPTQSNLSLQIKEKIVCLEIMGIDSGKALAHNPSLHSATLGSVESIITFLRSKGIQQKDLKKIFGMCPKILTSDIAADLIPVFDFLTRDLQVPFHSLRKVINKCPRLLASSARDQLKPALFYLQRLGFKDVEALAQNDAVLLVSSVEKTLIPKLRFLESLGVSKEEAVAMVVRCPTLFTFSIENNFKPKFEYLVEEMGRKVEEVKEFPQYFAFSLEKRIKPRHMEIVRRGLEREVGLPLMLISTDDQFTQLINPNPIPTPND
ncbi:transcription termination factor MTEF1, chloroplastic [Humulus lupulus]|uniref:transcription termination factor MTEF1, chloroplastic n=1 Tax=Humulus lupulus TaxID=3486 RepID=UPI002B40CC75|nr:transcription termination factor MTEF1, chloroplastic [Humulus lupulus]